MWTPWSKTACGFAGCREYAEAVAAGLAPINRCPPGGDEGIHALSLITHQLYLPLDPEYGRELPFAVARIRGDECIGCGRCRKVCPVDAITGGPKRLHAVIEDACTGCSLCQAACPIACISMVETGAEWTPEKASAASNRHQARKSRLERESLEQEARYAALGQGDLARKKAAIEAILALAAKK